MKNSFKFFVPFIVVLVIAGALIALKAVVEPKVSLDLEKKSVNTSFYPLYFFTTEIGGDKVQVTNITPAGAEPHDYDPTPQEIAGIESSPLLILNGANLEAWGSRITEELEGKGKVVVIAGEDLADQKIEEDGEIIRDPHVWLSPVLAKKEADKILDGLKKVDPENSSFYERNAANLKIKLDKLDNDYKQGLKSCKRKDIVTSHAAFSYLGGAYGLSQVTVTGISPDEEPSSKQLAEVSKLAKAGNVKYIFFESLVSPKLSETIADEIGAQTLVLDPIEGVSPEDMQAGRNYITIMEDNLKNLKIALECK